MQCNYNYIPEIKHVSRIYIVAAVLYLQFVLHVMLFHSLNMLCTFTLAHSAVCVLYQMWLFSVVPLYGAFPLCYSGIFRIIFRWFQSPLLLLVSLSLLRSTCAEFLL